MTFALCYWILMLLWLFFGVMPTWPASTPERSFRPFGGSLLQFVIIGLIGWRVFGPPLHQ